MLKVAWQFITTSVLKQTMTVTMSQNKTEVFGFEFIQRVRQQQKVNPVEPVPAKRLKLTISRTKIVDEVTIHSRLGQVTFLQQRIMVLWWQLIWLP
jgi:hypothetical protein